MELERLRKWKTLNDFRFESRENQVHVLNAPSPAATSCLAIADTVINELKNIFKLIIMPERKILLLGAAGYGYCSYFSSSQERV